MATFPRDDQTALFRPIVCKRAVSEVGADESDDALDKVMRKLYLIKKPEGDEKPKSAKN